MKSRATILALLTLVTTSLHAQEYPQKEVNLEVLADEIFGFQDIDLNYEELYENMALLLANKINLNTATAEELRFLNLLTEQQVQNLVHYRLETGPLLSVYELQAIPEFDSTTIVKIISFVKVDDSGNGPLLKRIFSEENNYFIVRYHQTLETKEGFTTQNPARRFKGDDGTLYMRFRTSKPGDFSLGFTLEKDAGEQITWNQSTKQYGFDYRSAHVQVMNKGRLKNFIVGDYQTQVGQGLLLGGSFGYGKGAEAVMTIRRSNLGFLPYTSANETGYKRGAAATVEVTRHVYLLGFYSNTLRDASVNRDTLENTFASSFQTTGLHRNENELAGRHAVREQQYGAVLNFRKGAVDGGVTFSALTYSVPVNRNPQPYNQFAFAGTSLSHTGFFLNYTFHNVTFFSEAVQTLHAGYGITAGLLGSLTPKLDAALHVRNYQRDFYSPYANAFSENSLPQNESGVYWGWKYRWNKKLSASGYADLFRFPWLRYRSYAPSSGHEWLLRVTYQPSRNILMFIQAREESKVRNGSNSDSQAYEVFTGTKRNYWINFDYPVSENMKMKTRAQFSTFDFEKVTSKGMVIFQDISVSLGKLSLSGRYAIFNTDDYDNRQYAYERDVWLAYSLPAYDGTGVRSYAVAQYNVTKKFTLWIRYAHTRYTDRDEIGSGVDTLAGNERNDIRIQARIKF